VLLGRLGAARLSQLKRDWFQFPKSGPQPGCRFFEETGHNVCGEVLKAWRSSGLEFDGRRGVSEVESLALFGLPLSDLQAEEIDGRILQAQWFERARFELHPENQPPYHVLLGLLGNETRPPPCPPDSSKYGFEAARTSWVPQTYVDSQAVTAVGRSERDMAKVGCYSLQITVDLIGGDAHRSKGEAWVDMLEHSPEGQSTPKDLTGHTISAWVYAPPGAGGDKSRPNGFQIFAKDAQSRNEYGPWYNVVEGMWVQVALTVSAAAPEGGFKDPEFDPGQISIIGIKIGAGGGSTARYQGVIYVDAVDW
jgi:hypothetical protein